MIINMNLLNLKIRCINNLSRKREILSFPVKIKRKSSIKVIANNTKMMIVLEYWIL